MKAKIRPALVLCLLISGIAITTTQAKAQKMPADSSQTPLWVSAMSNDSTVNYFKAVKNFEDYWKGKKTPDEVENQLKTGEKQKNEDKYAADYKRFKHWKMMNEPYVQEDGTILSKQKQLEVWETLRK